MRVSFVDTYKEQELLLYSFIQLLSLCYEVPLLYLGPNIVDLFTIEKDFRGYLCTIANKKIDPLKVSDCLKNAVTCST